MKFFSCVLALSLASASLPAAPTAPSSEQIVLELGRIYWLKDSDIRHRRYRCVDPATLFCTSEGGVDNRCVCL